MTTTHHSHTLIIILLSLLFSSALSSNAHTEDRTAQRLHAFYTEHYRLANSNDSVDYIDNDLSLIRQNCTTKFYGQIRNEIINGEGVDFLTYDYVDVMELQTMTFMKKGSSIYFLTFYANVPLVKGGTERKKICLILTLRDGLIDDVRETKE